MRNDPACLTVCAALADRLDHVEVVHDVVKTAVIGKSIEERSNGLFGSHKASSGRTLRVYDRCAGSAKFLIRPIGDSLSRLTLALSRAAQRHVDTSSGRDGSSALLGGHVPSICAHALPHQPNHDPWHHVPKDILSDDLTRAQVDRLTTRFDEIDRDSTLFGPE